MLILSIVMTVLFFNVVGLMFRIGWGIARGVFRFVGFFIAAALILSFAGVFFFPVIAVIALIALLTRGARRM